MTESTTKKPAYIAYHVREGADSKGHWNRVGAAWKNKDDSITLLLDCYPIDGRVILQIPKEKGEEEAS